MSGWDEQQTTAMRRCAPSVVMAISDLDGNPLMWKQLDVRAIGNGWTVHLPPSITVEMDGVSVTEWPIAGEPRYDDNIVHVTVNPGHATAVHK